jgi:hypothetical protein
MKLPRALLVTLTLVSLGTVAIAADVFSFTDSSNPTQTGPSSAEVDVPSGGALTITNVKVNGVALELGDDYTITNDGSSQPRINFFDPIPPNATIEVRGSSSNNGPFDPGQLTEWRPD